MQVQPGLTLQRPLAADGVGDQPARPGHPGDQAAVHRSPSRQPIAAGEPGEAAAGAAGGAEQRRALAQAERCPGVVLFPAIDHHRVVGGGAAEVLAPGASGVGEGAGVDQDALSGGAVLEAEQVAVGVGGQKRRTGLAAVGDEILAGRPEDPVAAVGQGGEQGRRCRLGPVRGSAAAQQAQPEAVGGGGALVEDGLSQGQQRRRRQGLVEGGVVEQRDLAVQVGDGLQEGAEAPGGIGQGWWHRRPGAAQGGDGLQAVQQHLAVVHRAALVVAAVGQHLHRRLGFQDPPAHTEPLRRRRVGQPCPRHHQGEGVLDQMVAAHVVFQVAAEEAGLGAQAAGQTGGKGRVRL